MKKRFQDNPQITQIRQAEDRKEANQRRRTQSQVAGVRCHWTGVPHSHVATLTLSLAFSPFNLCNLRNLSTVLVMMFHEPGRESRHGGIWVFAGQ